ncbi:MAG TPA: sulfatase-like hydrolase/transferase [Candidatus Alectryocaccobium stercorigallinarum]|nr:sulfatase-like hydrolase/transferase [Candidatus Alectryocaccobium stercorigallinarum]
MQFKEFGRKNRSVIVMIQPECARWDILKNAASILSKSYHLIIPVLPGYDEERPKSTFSSVEQSASDIEKWLLANNITQIECIYGCSMGGAIAAKIIADGNIDIYRAVIDSGTTPAAMPAPIGKIVSYKDWLFTKFDKKKDFSGMSDETLRRSFFSAKNYSLPESSRDTDTEIQYWYCSGEKKKRQGDIDFMKQEFPRVKAVEHRGRSCTDFLTRHFEEFCERLVSFIQSAPATYEEEKTQRVSGSIKSGRTGSVKHSGARNSRSRKKKNAVTEFIGSRKLTRKFFIPAGAFAIMLFYLECLLRIAGGGAPFFGMGLLRSLVSSIAVGALIWLITSLIPKKWISLIVAVVILFWVGFFVAAEVCVKDYFGTYYQISYMFGMSSQVAGDFGGDINAVIMSHFWLIPVAAVPCFATVIFRKKLFPKTKALRKLRLWIAQGAAIVLMFLLNTAVCLAGDNSYYTTNYTANSAIPQSGILNMIRLELKYGIFGAPTDGLGTDESYNADDVKEDDKEGSSSETSEGSETSESSKEPTTTPEPPKEYGDNVLNIDFNSLIASDTDETLLSMDQYFASQVPTKKNEYTGIFEGKNLIMITAEAFSYTVIDEERTPALYELANNGFVLNNCYQPDWTMSTTGGEFAHMTGIIPTWVNGSTSFTESSDNAMPFGLGWIFKAEGYSAKAYHNNTYSYYGRDLTHPNLGYDYVGFGNGLDIPSANSGWPASDLEMLQATIPADIEAYVNNGTPFHTYYMSVSGHGEYGWGENSMADKNMEWAESLGLDYSEQVLSYLAAQQELEYALEWLLDALEEAGIADDTVIVLTPDHYPYALTGDVDYYQELVGTDTNVNMTSYYKNSLIMWSGSIKEPVEVDTPCTPVDAVPTILNLFGIDYDSRLLSGRDVLAPDVPVGTVDSNMHAVVFPYSGNGRSWVTAAGTYESSTGTFTPAEGVELPDEAGYVAAVANLLENRYGYAKLIIQTDYYRHIFPNWSGGMKLTDALGAAAG